MQGCSCGACQMEDKSVTRSRSACRLAVQGNPGRVRYVFEKPENREIIGDVLCACHTHTLRFCRWLIGNEKHWRCALKVLIGVPIILIFALLISIALPHVGAERCCSDYLGKSYCF